MAKADGGELIARVMRENGVKYCFAINGGHLFPILGQLRNHDIKLIHMRHEQATAYAADAYARTSGNVGVCMVTAGCGLTNAVTGLCVAGLTSSAVVCISDNIPTPKTISALSRKPTVPTWFRAFRNSPSASPIGPRFNSISAPRFARRSRRRKASRCSRF